MCVHEHEAIEVHVMGRESVEVQYGVGRGAWSDIDTCFNER